MKTWKFLLVGMLCLTLGSGCMFFRSREGLAPFSGADYAYFQNDLERIQFYISDQIILSRETMVEKKQFLEKNRRVRILTNRYVYEITIPQHTPGIVKKVDGDTLWVQFEPSVQGKNRTLPFEKTLIEDDHGDTPDVEYCLAKDQLTYEGENYTVYYTTRMVPAKEDDAAVYMDNVPEAQSGERPVYIERPAYPCLLINPVEQIQNIDKNGRVVAGLRIGEE